ncbi:hypothetical protein ACFQ07_19690, partial [Actinomadura adrarensis]
VRSDLPLVVALADLRRRIDGGLGSRSQAARWSRALYGYLFYQVWEVGHRAAGSVPDLDSYLVARIFTSSLPVGIAWLEIANGYRIPDGELHSPSVRALGEMCCAVIGYDNDIISHWKETRRGGDGINLIDVLSRELQAPPAKALTEAVALRDRVLHRYLRLREQTLPGVSEPTRRYIGDLDAWIRGHIDWAMNSRRYRNPEVPVSGVADSPSRVDMAPVRGVAHWWDVTA